MTFITASQSDHVGFVRSATAVGLRSGRAAKRKPSANEDSARNALGTDYQVPVAMAAGASIEHLARIAWG